MQRQHDQGGGEDQADVYVWALPPLFTIPAAAGKADS